MTGDDDNLRYGDSDTGDGRGNGLQEEGPGGRGAFDPTPYFRQLRGRGGAQDYLDVKFRLLWLRREHPDAEILTEHIRIDDGVAIFKATVGIPGGGKATGHGSETAGDFPDYIEKAETKALGRALNALGYGAQFVDAETDEEAPSVPQPPPARPATQTATRPAAAPAQARPASVDEPPAAPAPTPMTTRATTDRRTTTPPARPAPVEIGAARERPAPPSPTPFPGAAPARQPAATAGVEQEPPLEDYSWTAFWKWAREQGYESKGGIEAFIGRPMNNLNPAEVRQLILAKRDET